MRWSTDDGPSAANVTDPRGAISRQLRRKPYDLRIIIIRRPVSCRHGSKRCVMTPVRGPHSRNTHLLAGKRHETLLFSLVIQSVRKRKVQFVAIRRVARSPGYFVSPFQMIPYSAIYEFSMSLYDFENIIGHQQF